MNLISINPANNKKINSYQEISKDSINQIIDSSFNTFLEWRSKSFSYRAK
jgi:NAD-dependent aldehyde dehydrogenases